MSENGCSDESDHRLLPKGTVGNFAGSDTHAAASAELTATAQDYL